MSTERVTVPEKLLIAALEVRKRSATFTAEDLIVEAWRRYPDTFGLSGYSDRYPDSNRVLTNIMGTKGMRGKGWLRKVGEKQYRLTSTGLSDGETLLRGVTQATGESSAYLRAELDRQTTAALQRLLSTGAARKALEARSETISFHDACGFWDITARSNANTLNVRLADTHVLLDRAMGALSGKDESEGLKLSSGFVTKAQIMSLRNLHNEMLSRFKNETDIIRRRTDERLEKRSRPL